MFFSLVSLLLNVSSRLGGILLMIGVAFALEIFIEGLEIWGPKRTPLFRLLAFIGNSDYRDFGDCLRCQSFDSPTAVLDRCIRNVCDHRLSINLSDHALCHGHQSI